MRRIVANHHKKIIPYGLILFAFFLQTRYLVELQATFPDSFGRQPFCGVDAQAHIERAVGLLDGSIPGSRAYSFIPLYPYYLAVLRSFLGHSLLVPVFIQALLQLVGLAALHGIGRLVFNPLTGILATLGMATYSYYLFYLPCFDQSLLTVPFLTLGVFFLLQLRRYQTTSWFLVPGIFLAIAALSRPTILIVFPAIILWHYHNLPSLPFARLFSLSSKTSWLFIKSIFWLILPGVIFVSPITWHNYQATGRFLLLTDNFDVNLYTGNNPDAAGLDSLAQVQSQPAVIRFQNLYPRVEAGETTLGAEILHYIQEQPEDWLALTATKIWLWFGEVDERLVSPFFPLSVSQSRLLARLPLEWQAAMIVALLAFVIVPTRSRRQTLLLWLIYGTFSVATIAFFIQLRFRLPLAPFVFLSGASLMAIAPQLKFHYSRRFWTVLLILLLLYPIVPTLWIFILIFAGLGFWPVLGLQNKNVEAKTSSSLIRHRLSFVVVSIYLFLVGLWLRAQTANAVQTIDHYFGPPLVGKGVLGQTFQVNCSGLNRIDVTLGVFEDSRPNPPVTFYLASDLSAQEILFSETFEGSLVADYQQKSFSFAPIPDSTDRTFFFFISSPNSTPQNAITARGYTDTPFDRYPKGSAFAGSLGALQEFEADFAFAAYCDASLWQKVWRW